MRLLGTPALFQGLRCDSKTPSVVKKEQVSAADDIFDTLVVNDDFCLSFFFFSISSLSYNLFGHFFSSLHAVVYVTKLPTHSLYSSYRYTCTLWIMIIFIMHLSRYRLLFNPPETGTYLPSYSKTSYMLGLYMCM